MKRVLIFAALALWLGCGEPPEPTAETSSAFTCAHYSSFTHLCTQWVPSLIPGAPTNYVPAGAPQWCPTVDGQWPPTGWARVLNDQPVAGNRYCAHVPPGNYGDLGDWNYTSSLPGQLPSVHVRALITGQQAYAFVWDAPNFSGNFIGYYPPESVVSFTSTVGSFELIQGQ